MLALNRSATLATWPFRNSPWHLGQDNLLTILFSADNLTLQCPDYDTYRYTVTLTLGLWQQRTSLRLVPKVITVTMIRVIHPHHNATRRWRASVSNLTDATSCHSLTLTAASSSVAATFQLPRFFSRVVCNWAAWGSLLETFTRVVLYFFRGNSGLWSYFAVIVHMRKSIFGIIQALLWHVHVKGLTCTCQRSAWMIWKYAKYAFIVLCIAGLHF